MQETLNILLVEDNEGDVEMVKHALAHSDPLCNIAVANDGLEALDWLHERAGTNIKLPHLILLDLNMPRMDGKKFLEEVKKKTRLKAIPVVVLTSSESPGDVRECYERQASSYVAKPFDGKEFGAVVRDVVRFWGKVSKLPVQ